MVCGQVGQSGGRDALWERAGADQSFEGINT